VASVYVCVCVCVLRNGMGGVGVSFEFAEIWNSEVEDIGSVSTEIKCFIVEDNCIFMFSENETWTMAVPGCVLFLIM
jgi:hypothetical protein